MHASSYENMKKCYDRYIGGMFSMSRKKLTVIDIGSASVNGSYRDIFCGENTYYTGVDLGKGEGVDIVLESPYQLPLEDSSADIVLSGQMLEHCEYFWLAFEEMLRILKPDGVILLIVPSAGPIHRYPVDCYRFYPDAFVALAKLNNCNLVDSWLDERGPWKDLVGVFSKADITRWSDCGDALTRQVTDDDPNYSNSVLSSGYLDDAEVDIVSGDISYLELLQMSHSVLEPKLYMEIGVRHGASLSLAQCTAIGIDPAPDMQHTLKENVSVYHRTSDVFFEVYAPGVLDRDTIDLSFIDGLHLFENVLKDFINIEKYASQGSVVIIDDIYPNHPVQAERIRRSRVWVGDVWKIVGCLKQYRPDLELFPLNTSPAGSLLIHGLDPNNAILVDNYNSIVRSYRDDLGHIPPLNVIERQEAVSTDRSTVLELLKYIRDK